MGRFACLFCLVGLVALAVGCGGGDGNTDPSTSLSAQTEPTVEVPDGALPAGATPVLEKDNDPETIALYEDTAFLFDAGPSLDEYIRITVPQQPMQDVTIRYPVPADFLEQLGDGYRPMLYAQMEQGGADNEELTTFEPLDYQFDGNVLQSALPPYAFGERESGFEAIILVGSIPAERVDPNGGLKRNSPPGDLPCRATTIASPLDGDLEVIDKAEYGVWRPRKKDGKDVMVKHQGVDLRAANGTLVRAVAKGKVQIGIQKDGGKVAGWGHIAVLTREDNSRFLYAHLIEGSTEKYLRVRRDLPLQKVTLLSDEFFEVEKGDVIGESDSSGHVEGPHLHLEYIRNGIIFEDNKKIDPYPCIASVQAEQGGLVNAQVIVSDDGLQNDDAFSISLDYLPIGNTNVGEEGTFGLGSLRPGTHTLTVEAIKAPDNLGTARIVLGQGTTFEDGHTEKSVQLRLHQTESYRIMVR